MWSCNTYRLTENLKASYRLECWMSFCCGTHVAHTEHLKFVRNLEKFCITVHILNEPYMNNLILWFFKSFSKFELSFEDFIFNSW
jgi:hypothetical protein